MPTRRTLTETTATHRRYEIRDEEDKLVGIDVEAIPAPESAGLELTDLRSALVAATSLADLRARVAALRSRPT